GLTSSYSKLNLPKDELHIDEDEDPPIASGPAETSVTAQEDGLNSSYSVLKLGKDEFLIDVAEDPPTVLGSAEISVTAEADVLNSTYSVIKLPNDEHLTEEYEDAPIASGPAEMSVVAQTGPHKQEPNENIGNRPDRKICLLCLVTFVFFVTVVGLSIYVSQIRLSEFTFDRNFQLLREEYHEMNRTQRQCRLQVLELNSSLESTIFENSHLNLSRRSCLKNVFALKSNLSDLKQIHNDLRHQFCELLTSIREQTCSKDWIRNEDLCYFISSFGSSYQGAKQLCSIADSKLLQRDTEEKENFVNNRVRGQDGSYWIGTCKEGEVASNVVYKVNAGKFECGECKSRWPWDCRNDQHRFICEKSAPLFRDIPEKIRDLCQKPVEPT
ncbi:uncharacterized protein LOC132390463, partial [Hypanus sabinus]|uniref:uncharacterized protein LOC132390463 n=1 Tax=Hypanus sabinus TaxID=79690 RepID=UPI0028C37A6F